MDSGRGRGIGWRAMTDPPITPERMVAIARARGLALDTERARALQPAVESLGMRLIQMGRELPVDAVPAPGPVEGVPTPGPTEAPR